MQLEIIQKLNEAEQETTGAASTTSGYDLAKIFETSGFLRDRAKSEIKFQKPILKISGQPFIYPSTITIIQGPTGAHKSRLTEAIASVLMSRVPLISIGIERQNIDRSMVVILIDTERNLQDQLPYAIQQMKLRAGYQINDDPPMFEYISLLDVPRKYRFTAIQAYLGAMQEKYNLPLFVILDVITDCIEDFNRVDNTMNIIDEMNRFINHYDTTFLCVIHENPGSEKARGHLGTEIANKSSTIMKIGFLNNAGDNTDILKLSFLKMRSAKRPEPIHLKYCDNSKGLIQVDEDEIRELRDNSGSVPLVAICNFLERLFKDGRDEIPKSELYKQTEQKFQVRERTLDNKLNDIIAQKNIIMDSEGRNCNLQKISKGKNVVFTLKSTDNQ